MSTFDPIVYNAVKQINAGAGGGSAARTIGELMLVPSGYVDADYIEVGSSFAPATYPQLAAKFNEVSHISVLNHKGELPAVTTLPTGMFFAFSPTTSDIWGVDGTNGHYFTSTDGGATFTYTDQYVSFPVGGKPIGGFNYVVNQLSTNGLVMRYSDPTNWEPIGSIATFYGVVPITSNFFIAVNPNAAATTIQTSTDCVSWTARTVPSLTYKAIAAWNGSMYVVLSTTTGYVTSPDGITWTSRTAPFVPSNVKVIGTTFVLIPNSAAIPMYSADGITWTACTGPVSSGYAVYQTSTGLVIKTGTTAAYSSTDGINWTSVTMPSTSTAIYSSEARDVMIQVSSFPTYHVSTDLFATYSTITWAAGAATCDWAITAASPTSIIIAETNIPGYVYRSTDEGASWTQISLPSNIKCTSLAYANGIYMAAGLPTVGYVTSTDDGLTWSSVTPWPPTQTPTIANIICKTEQSDYFYVWVGNASVAFVFRSDDGVKWTYLSGLFGGGMANNAWMVFKDRLIGAGTTGTSVTGVNLNNKGTAKGNNSWTGSISPLNGCRLFVTNGQVALAFNALADTANYLYSYDGRAWTAGTLPYAMNVDNAVWNGTHFICFTVVASQSETQVLTSIDGVTWEVSTINRHLLPANSTGMYRHVTPFMHKGVTYLSINNYRQLMALEQTNPPKLPYVSPPSPATKYVVKAK